MTEDKTVMQNTEPETTPTPEAEGGQGRTFTQAEVNSIVQDRLARARRETVSDEREAELKAREARLDCREFLSDKKYPAELLDILSTADVAVFKANVELLAGLFRGMEDHGPTITIDTGAPLTGSPRRSDPFADAFKPPKI